MPNGAIYCPNCGSSGEQKQEIRTEWGRAIFDFLKIAIPGAILSITIILFSAPLDLYFIPSFVASLIVVYLSRTKKIEYAIVISAIVYLLTDGIINGTNLAILYLNNQSFADYPEIVNKVPTLLDVLMYIISPITVFVAAYLGSRFSPKIANKPMYSHKKDEGSGPGGVVYVNRNIAKNFCPFTSQGLNTIRRGLV